MRFLSISVSLIFIAQGCGQLDSLTGSSSDSGQQTDYRGAASKNDSSFAGTYVLESMEVMGDSGTLFMSVLEGRCAMQLSSSDTDGWRSLSNNSYCRIGNKTYNSLIVETAFSRIQLNSLGAVINVDSSRTQSTASLPKDLRVLESSVTFTYSGMIGKYTLEQNATRIYQTLIYRKE